MGGVEGMRKHQCRYVICRWRRHFATVGRRRRTKHWRRRRCGRRKRGALQGWRESIYAGMICRWRSHFAMLGRRRRRRRRGGRGVRSSVRWTPIRYLIDVWYWHFFGHLWDAPPKGFWEEFYTLGGFKCPIFHFFLYGVDLWCHMLLKKLKCNQCNYIFAQASNLRTHLKTNI